ALVEATGTTSRLVRPVACRGALTKKNPAPGGALGAFLSVPRTAAERTPHRIRPMGPRQPAFFSQPVGARMQLLFSEYDLFIRPASLQPDRILSFRMV